MSTATAPSTTSRDQYQQRVRARVAEWRAGKSAAPVAPAPRRRGCIPQRPPQPAGPAVLVIKTHVVRPGRRQEFLELMNVMSKLHGALLKPLAGQRDLVEDRGRPMLFLEILKFPSAREFEDWDSLVAEHRKLAAIEALLDDLLHTERADFRVLVAPTAEAPPSLDS